MSFTSIGFCLSVCTRTGNSWCSCSKITKARLIAIIFHHLESLSYVSQCNINPPLTKDSVNSSNCYTIGKISYGETFYKYRILLYEEDFKPHSQLFPRGSLGGIYISPASLHLDWRRSQASVRTLSLSPSGLWTNYILHYIIDDLVQGYLEGFQVSIHSVRPCPVSFKSLASLPTTLPHQWFLM